MIIKNAEYIKTAVDFKDLPKDNLIEIALAGRSNVGKSSFINAIGKNSHLARVSKTPGKTITLNYYLFNKSFYIVDMPGYGYAKRGDESLKTFSVSTDTYIKNRENLKAIILIVDSRVISEDDKLMIDYLKDNNINYFVIMNKIDKLKRNDILKRKQETIKSLNIPPEKLYLYSSYTHEKEEDILSLFDFIIN